MIMTKRITLRVLAPTLGLVLLGSTLSGCAVLAGAALGAGSGAAIAAGTGHDPAKGALIGTGIGAAAGGLYHIAR